MRSIVGMDCGFDNPIFAAIELDYKDADQVRGRVHFLVCESMAGLRGSAT